MYIAVSRHAGCAQEEIRDLLAPDLAGPAQGVHIREVVGGGVCLSGAAEREVSSQEEMAAVLEQARSNLQK